MNNVVYAGGSASSDGKRRIHNGFAVVCFAREGGLKADGKIYACTENSAAVIPPRTEYEVVGCGDGLCAVIEQALLPSKGVKIIAPPSSLNLISAVEKAAEIFPHTGAEKEIVLPALGNLIAAYVAAYCGGDILSPVVAQVKGDIDAHFGEVDYSLEAAIRALPLNYDYIRKLFVKETGITPHEYLTRRRMDRARDILLSGVTNRYSNYTVSQISEACGFAEPLYFSRVFKKYFGESPSAYLRKYKEKNI